MRASLFAVALGVAGVACAGVAHAEIVDARALYPEGAYWRDGRIFYTEMAADQVVSHARGRKRIEWRETSCGPTSLAPWGDGLLVLCHMSASLVALGPRGAPVRRWSRDDAGVRLQNPNDSSADGRGGVYFSDPGPFSVHAPVSGAILRLAADGALSRVAENLHYPNGVFFDRDEHALYVSEHLRRRVLRFPVLEDGGLGAMTVFADLARLTTRTTDYPEAGPDGLERGPNGDLYVCIYGEGRILRLSRAGELVASIAAPMPYVTNIAFAPDGAAYVTGAHENVRPPLRGALARLAPAALGFQGAPR